MCFIWEIEKFVHMFLQVSQMKKFVHVFLVENEKVYSCVSGGK